MATSACAARNVVGAPVGAPPPFGLREGTKFEDGLAKLGCKKTRRENRFSISSLPRLTPANPRETDLRRFAVSFLFL